MERITNSQLETLCDRINSLLNAPKTAYTRNGNSSKANIGHHYIDSSYGGVCLHRMNNEGGGVTCPLVEYHVTKRELYNSMKSYISGLCDSK